MTTTKPKTKPVEPPATDIVVREPEGGITPPAHGTVLEQLSAEWKSRQREATSPTADPR